MEPAMMMPFSPISSELASPLTDSVPSGINIEYDSDFLILEREICGKPEIEYGASLTQASPPNWQLVKSLSLSLMEKSRDLRLAIYLSRALLNLYGIPGLENGLALVNELLESRWNDVHPQLDPDDDDDPLQRINILSFLCEPAGILRELRETPLVSTRALGQFSLRDFEIANGESSAVSEQERTTLTAIDAAFREAGQDTLLATANTLTSAFDCSIRIEQFLTDKVGSDRAIDFSPLSSILHRAIMHVRRHLVDTPATNEAIITPFTNVSSASLYQGDVANREDVKKNLDRICLYYSTHEPASPVPLLLERARDLVDKKFMELVQDLATDGLAQLSLISGIKSER
jgi:type VI secretion system protein ImpA